MGSTFATVSAIVAAEGNGRFVAQIHGDWTVAGKPNGGYLLALLGRAAVTVGAHPHVLAASAHYLQAPEPGPAEIEAEVLRSGRSASQLRVRLRQGGRDCVEALLMTGVLADSDGSADPYWAGGLVRPEIAPRDVCMRVPGVAPTGIPVPIMNQVDLRLDPAVCGFAEGRPSGRGELVGWLALGADEAFDPVSLLYAADALPPATFEIQPTGWVPTLELTVYIRALPTPGPVQVLQRAHVVEGQRVDEATFIWDGTGRLVAQATQLAAIRLGDPVTG